MSEEENTLSPLLPEDMRESESLTKFKDIGSLAKSYLSLEQMQTGSIRIPGEDSSDDQRAEFLSKLSSVDGVVRLPGEDEDSQKAFYDKLGRPQDPNGYEYKISDDLADKIEVDADQQANFLSKAHELGLTKAQVKGLLDHSYSETANAFDQISTSNDEGLKSLKEAWGSAYDQRVDAAIESAKLVGEKYPELNELLADPLNQKNAGLIYVLSEFSKTVKESGSPKGLGGKSFGLSVEEATAKVSEIRSNPEHPYHKGDEAAVRKVEDLYAIIHAQ